MLLAMTKPSATGMTCVTPSPLSITVPVSVLMPGTNWKTFRSGLRAGSSAP
jgi:hypothetical protein